MSGADVHVSEATYTHQKYLTVVIVLLPCGVGPSLFLVVSTYSRVAIELNCPLTSSLPLPMRRATILLSK